MKILVVCQHYYPENFTVTKIAERFVALGHDVLVVTGKPNYGFKGIPEEYRNVTDEVINGVRVHRVNLVPRGEGTSSIIRNYLSFWRNSKRYIRRLKEKFDCVYSMSLSPVISVVGANMYAKKHHVPHILHCLDLWPESPVITGAIKKGSLAYKILYRWSKSIYEKADQILLSSPSFQDYFEKELHLKGTPLFYVPQPAFLPSEESKTIEYDAPYNFVYAGNIGRLQLVENVVEGFALADIEDAKLHLIGMGARLEAVKTLVKEKGLEDKVIIYGPMNRQITAGYYPNATAILVTLSSEGYVGKTIPNKLISSMLYARPILACIQGDGRKVLEESGGAIFSNDESKESFAKAFVEATSCDQEKLGQANRAYYLEHFDFDKVVDQIIDHLKTPKTK